MGTNIPTKDIILLALTQKEQSTKNDIRDFRAKKTGKGYIQIDEHLTELTGKDPREKARKAPKELYHYVEIVKETKGYEEQTYTLKEDLETFYRLFDILLNYQDFIMSSYADRIIEKYYQASRRKMDKQILTFFNHLEKKSQSIYKKELTTQLFKLVTIKCGQGKKALLDFATRTLPLLSGTLTENKTK